MASKNSKADEKVQVTVRCRPINQSERSHRVKKVIECNNKTREVHVATSTTALGLTASQQTKVYNFDRVFGPLSTQLDVYKNVVESQLQDVLAGYNCTVLAYGQTGTGKTYTMEGERTIGEDYMWDTDPRAGIIPRALSQLFDCLDKTGSEFSVRVSLLEIYNEEIYDLLSHSTDMLKMKIYEDNSRKGSVVVSGLTEVHVRDKSDVYDILQQGAAKRRTAATNLNEFSSRSHSVFSVTVHTKDITHSNMEEEELVKIGKLNLVDLAGSENIGRSGAVDKRAREAGNINQSLLTLGRCITALVDRAPHVPYRESKLTRLLQDSLGGATKTSIIATISPGSDNLEETLSTLDYAARAKNIHNKPRVNQKLTKRALIKEYDDEIEKLRREVVALREKNGVYVDPKTYSEMMSRIESLTATVKQREEDVEKFQQLFTDTSAQLTERTERLHILHDDLTQTRKELAEQCCLKDAYIEHAADAVNHASQLLEAADLVTDDIEKVHDKVDRVKQVHENNLNTARSFSGKLKDDVSLLCQGTVGALEQNQTNLQKTMDGLGLMKQEHGKSLDALTACVTALHLSMNDVFKKTAETLNKISTNAQSRRNEHDDALSELKNNIETAINKWEGKGKKLSCVVKNLVGLVDLVKTSTKSQCEQLESYVTASKRHEETVAEYVAEINATNAQLREKQERVMEEMQTNMKTLSENMMMAFDVTKDKGKSLNQSAETFSKESHENVAVQKAGVKQTEEQVTKVILKDCVDPIEIYLEETGADAKDLWHNVSMHNVAISTIMNLMASDEETEIENGNKQLLAASEVVSSFSNQCHRDVTTLGQSMNQHIDDANDLVSSVGSKITVMEEDIEEAETSILQAVDDCFQERLETIVPTGITPARKAYEYPSRIPRAPLQEDVLTNFRERILDEESQEEDGATEEEEDDNEEDKPCRSDSGVSATSAVDINLNQSITIPDVGGIPFFKKSRKGKVHSRKGGKAQGSRIPFRPVQNLD